MISVPGGHQRHQQRPVSKIEKNRRRSQDAQDWSREARRGWAIVGLLVARPGGLGCSGSQWAAVGMDGERGEGPRTGKMMHFWPRGTGLGGQGFEKLEKKKKKKNKGGEGTR